MKEEVPHRPAGAGQRSIVVYTTKTLVSGTKANQRAVWGSSPYDVWAVGDTGTVLHFDGWSQWKPVAQTNTADLYGVYARSPTEVWAVGPGVVLRHDGVTSTSVAINWLWGSGTSDVWAVGDSGWAARFDGGTWTKVTAPFTETPLVFHSVAPDDVLAVGTGGLRARYQKGTWSKVTGGSTLRAVWQLGQTLFVAGDSGTVWRGDAGTWTALDSGFGGQLNSEWGVSSSAVFAVGADSTILRRGGP